MDSVSIESALQVKPTGKVFSIDFDPKAIELLCELEKFNEWIWENACGEGHLSKELQKQGYQVYSKVDLRGPKGRG